jgi:hypothetical protein
VRKLIGALVVLAASAVVVLSFGVASAAPPVGQICPGDKIDTSGNPLTITVDAGDGNVVTAICVKAGSAQQGNGAVILLAGEDFPAGQQVVTVGYPGGKAISHYSYTVEKKEEPCPPEDLTGCEEDPKE